MKSDKEKRKRELLELLQDVDQVQQPDIAEEENTRNEYDLIMQCKSGDRAAFDQLIRRYQDNAYTYVKQIVKDDEKAFNATRDTFVSAYKTISHFRGELSVKAWLLRIAERQVFKVSGKGYMAFLPLRLYQWFQQMLETEERSKEASKSEGVECKELRGLFSAYLDSELNTSEITRVEAHLASCEPCRLEYEELEEAVDLVQAFGLMSAPAHLHRQIIVELNRETPWEKCIAYLKKFTENSPFSVSKLASVAATIVIVFLVMSYYTQREQILRLETQLRATRGVDSGSPEITLNTFMIFTGKIVSEEMPTEAAEYVWNLLPEPDKAPEPQFIPGDITSVGNEIADRIRLMQGNIAEDLVFQEKNLSIRKITAELPRHSNSLVYLFLHQLEGTSDEPGESSGITTTSIEIYIIDKLSR